MIFNLFIAKNYFPSIFPIKRLLPLVDRVLPLINIVRSRIDVTPVPLFPLLQLFPEERVFSWPVEEELSKSVEGRSVPKGVIEGQGEGVGIELGLSEKDRGTAPRDSRHRFSRAIRSRP